MIGYQIPCVEVLQSALLEQRLGMSARAFLGFGSRDKNIEFKVTDNGDMYIGEIDLLNNLNGRGVVYVAQSELTICHFEDNRHAPGNFISIKPDGNSYGFGEFYLDEKGVLASRATSYDKDGNCY